VTAKRRVVAGEEVTAMRMASRRVAVSGLALVLALAGCASGGDEPPSGSGCSSITFTPAVTAPADGDVFLSAPLNTCTDLNLTVMIDDLSGVYTVSFDLAYPGTVLRYAACLVGPLLTKQGPQSAPVCLVTETGAGRLAVAISRLNPDPSVTAGASEVLATLRFQRVAAGAGAIDFDTDPATGAESVQDEFGNVRPASFGPDHGGLVSVP
jgi:hypothetical protein